MLPTPCHGVLRRQLLSSPRNHPPLFHANFNFTKTFTRDRSFIGLSIIKLLPFTRDRSFIGLSIINLVSNLYKIKILLKNILNIKLKVIFKFDDG